jgi:hypothetical protein
MALSLQATVEKLREESALWESQSDPLSGTASSVDSLTITGIDAGIFAGIMNAYNNHCTTISSLVRQGAGEALEAADSIDRSATAYENNEAESTEIISNTFDR